jgi:hypothetical protein
MPRYFREFPKREWTKQRSDAEFDKLQAWWDAHEEELLIEMPEVKDNKGEYIRLMLGAFGFASELDDILSEQILEVKAAAALDIADLLGYRDSHDVPKGREYEWFKKSVEAGRGKRKAKLDELLRSLD